MDTAKFGVAASNEANSIVVFAYYNGNDVKADDLAAVLPGVEEFSDTLKSDNFVDQSAGVTLGDATPGLVFRIEKWY